MHGKRGMRRSHAVWPDHRILRRVAHVSRPWPGMVEAHSQEAGPWRATLWGGLDLRPLDVSVGGHIKVEVFCTKPKVRAI